jgi:hypothetical protein
MIRECTCCAQSWATTYHPMIGPVCYSCNRELMMAGRVLESSGMCRPPESPVWYRQMRARGEILVEQ